MARRFLTAEDVHRAGGREIQVDEGTVVTPQALEAAKAKGMEIRTPSGHWKEPTPDRGPGATLAAERSSRLPEPAGGSSIASDSNGAVVTALGHNRSGVLAEITAVIASLGVNVIDVSQKVVSGYFHMALTVELPDGVVFADVKARLESLGSSDDFTVRVVHERAFRFMHRV